MKDFFHRFFRSEESEHAGMKKRLARLVELSREQSQTAQENLKLAQDSARLEREPGNQNRNDPRFATQPVFHMGKHGWGCFTRSPDVGFFRGFGDGHIYRICVFTKRSFSSRSK